MEPELVFSDGLVTALGVLFAVCLLMPVMYYVWSVYRKKLNHAALLGGLAAFFLFGYLISGVLLGALAPESRLAELGMWRYALGRALSVAVAEAGGMWLALWFLHRQYATVRVPIGFGLGFRLFDLLYLGAFNAMFRLANALTVNKEGLQVLLDNVEAEAAPALELQLRALAASSPKLYLMSAVDYVCMFALSVALSRILWYTLEGGKLSADKRLLVPAFLLRFFAELMLALDRAGGNYQVCAAIYYVLVAAAVCLAYYLSRQRDDPEVLREDRLKARQLRRRR